MSNILHSQERGDVLAHVSGNLRRFRLAAGLSQVALAEASGISRRMIVALEGGDANISLSSLDKLYGAPGSSTALDTIFNKFTGALQSLQNDPSSYSLRSQVLANEKGCLQYDFFKSKADGSTYIIMEQYATQADLDAHGKSDYFKAAGAKFGGWLAGAPSLVFAEKIG